MTMSIERAMNHEPVNASWDLLHAITVLAMLIDDAGYTLRLDQMTSWAGLIKSVVSVNLTVLGTASGVCLLVWLPSKHTSFSMLPHNARHEPILPISSMSAL